MRTTEFIILLVSSFFLLGGDVFSQDCRIEGIDWHRIRENGDTITLSFTNDYTFKFFINGRHLTKSTSSDLNLSTDLTLYEIIHQNEEMIQGRVFVIGSDGYEISTQPFTLTLTEHCSKATIKILNPIFQEEREAVFYKVENNDS